jgi:hypothetical protein
LSTTVRRSYRRVSPGVSMKILSMKMTEEPLEL